VGFLYDRCHTRHLKSYGGVGALLPWLTFYMTFFILANTGLPGLSGFIGELSILWVSYSYSPLLACLAATSLVFSAIVNLRLLIAIFYGPTSGDILDLEQNNVADCRSYEHHILLILAGLTLFFGLWPQYIFQWLEPESLRLAHVISQLKGAF
jgi:NADH-quinone oxidoreductase subunit M